MITLPDDFILFDDHDGPWQVTFNGQPLRVGRKSLTYMDICRVTGHTNRARQADVTWWIKGDHPAGVVREEDEMDIQDNLIVNVAYTDSA